MKLLDATTRIALKNILVATDFSEAPEVGLVCATKMARRYGSTLHVIHVIPPEVSAVVPIGVPEALASMGKERRQARESLTVRERLLGRLPHDIVLAEGDVSDSILQFVQKKGIDMVVMGSHGRTGLKRLLLGSVAEEVFRQAECPVLIFGPNAAKAGSEWNFRRILFATDLAPKSVAASYALSLAQEYRSQLLLVHIAERHEEETFYDGRVKEHLVDQLKALVPGEAYDWCQPAFVVEFGSPASRIVELASEFGADLIVMGVRGARHNRVAHSPFATEHKVISEAGCPVLTVKGRA